METLRASPGPAKLISTKQREHLNTLSDELLEGKPVTDLQEEDLGEIMVLLATKRRLLIKMNRKPEVSKIEGIIKEINELITDSPVGLFPRAKKVMKTTKKMPKSNIRWTTLTPTSDISKQTLTLEKPRDSPYAYFFPAAESRNSLSVSEAGYWNEQIDEWIKDLPSQPISSFDRPNAIFFLEKRRQDAIDKRDFETASILDKVIDFVHTTDLESIESLESHSAKTKAQLESLELRVINIQKEMQEKREKMTEVKEIALKELEDSMEQEYLELSERLEEMANVKMQKKCVKAEELEELARRKASVKAYDETRVLLVEAEKQRSMFYRELERSIRQKKEAAFKKLEEEHKKRYATFNSRWEAKYSRLSIEEVEKIRPLLSILSSLEKDLDKALGKLKL